MTTTSDFRLSDKTTDAINSRWLARIRLALHPVTSPPAGAAWNLDELRGLLAPEPKLKPAAVLIGLRPRGGESDGFSVLLTIRNQALRHHAGQVSFPGGRIEPSDAGPLAGALREAREEVGIAADAVRPLGWLDPLATVTGFRVLPLVALLDADAAIVPDPGEVAGVFEVPIEHLLADDNLLRIPMDYRGQTRHVLEYRPFAAEAPRIWGATASIMRNLIDRLRTAEADSGPG